MSLKNGEDYMVSRPVAGARKVVRIDESDIIHSLTCDPMYIRTYVCTVHGITRRGVCRLKYCTV